MTGHLQEGPASLSPLTLHLMAIFRARQRIADALSAEHGLTPTQMSALFRLWEQASCSMSDLQDQLNLTTGAVTGVVDRLEARGLVERFASPDDRRFCFARLTEAGRTVVGAISHGWEQHLEAWLAQVPPSARAHVEEVFGAMALVAGSVPEGPPRGRRRGKRGASQP